MRDPNLRMVIFCSGVKLRPDTQSGMLPREDDEFLFNFSERQNISSNSQQLVVQLYTTASQTVYNNN